MIVDFRALLTFPLFYEINLNVVEVFIFSVAVFIKIDWKGYNRYHEIMNRQL